MDPTQLVVVAAIVGTGSLLGGISGFGYGLVAAPLLLTAGVPLSSIVVLNLALGIVTRGFAAWRLRDAVSRTALFLIVGSVPGYVLGAVLLDRIDVHLLKVATGVVVVVLAAVSLLQRRPMFRPGRGTYVCTGVAGGALGAATSLNGVVPALVMTQSQVPNRQFLADLAAYFVGSSVVGMLAILPTGVDVAYVWPLVAVSVPVSVAANLAGTSLGSRLPPRVFRTLTIVVAICAGVAAIFS